MNSETVTEDPIHEVSFKSLNLADHFFDSLRCSYPGFDEWVTRKATANDTVWMATDAVTNGYSAMLYLKEEDDAETAVTPPLTKPRLKIGTFKVDFQHHTSLGKRLLAIALRKFAESGLPYVYVTMYDNENTHGLKSLLCQYGFKRIGMKEDEEVWAKRRPDPEDEDPYQTFPFLTSATCHYHVLAIKPEYHSKMFGDVRLRTEKHVPVQDDVRTNTVEKIYLSGSPAAALLQKGDRVAIYRTAPSGRLAEYSSVISSICTITNVKDIRDFQSAEAFFQFVHGRSVFTQSELDTFWESKKYPFIISMLFNFPLKRRPIRRELLEQQAIPEGRLVCAQIDNPQFEKILHLGNADESYIIH